MRTLAFISDIHGNSAALEAALDDIDGRGVTEIHALGDLVGYGPDPGGVIALVRDNGIPTILGNYDDGVAFDRGGCGCYYADDEARRLGDASYAFTVAAVTPEDTAWLREQPYRRVLEVGAHRLLLVHGSPRRINEYLAADRDPRTYERLAADIGAQTSAGLDAAHGGIDVLVFGHTHAPWHREHGGVLFVNAGSVGRPKDGDPRAMYTLVHLPEADRPEPARAAGGTATEHSGNIRVEVVRVPYDVERTARGTLEAGLPAALADAFRHGR